MQIQWPVGIDTQGFLDQYWQQRPLLIKNAFPHFENPLDENELAGLALDEDANARFMECIDGHEWRLSHGPFDEDFFSTLSGNQWSLLVSDIEKLLPDFRDYLQPFRFVPDWRIDDLMVSYAPVGGSVGAHVDEYDVFLLQAAGVRQWQFENHARPPSHDPTGASIALLGDFNADETHELQAGDMLYLPPRFAHHGIAVADPCMTWSIGYRAPSSDEVLTPLVSYLLDEIQPERFTDARRVASDDPGLITEKDFEGMRDLIRRALQTSDDRLDKCIGRLLSEPAMQEQPEPLTLTSEELFSADRGNGAFICHSGHALAYKADNNSALLFANGECFAVSRTLASRLCNDRRIVRSQIDSEDRAVITALVNQHTLFEDDEHRQH
jgi:50S ribosomal protein L16 3-hydroxylase